MPAVPWVSDSSPTLFAAGCNLNYTTGSNVRGPWMQLQTCAGTARTCSGVRALCSRVPARVVAGAAAACAPCVVGAPDCA